jgi:hypothetical protein
MRPLPAHGGDDRRESNARGEWFCEPGEHAIVAVGYTRQPPLADVVSWTPTFGERAGADQSRIGGMKACDVLPGQPPLARQPPAAWPCAKDVVKTAIGPGTGIELPERAIEALPESLQWPQT